MELRPLHLSDSSSILEINEQGLPGTGKVSEEEIVNLLSYSSFAVGIFDDNSLLGFVICLPPKTAYGSLNYRWFNERYSDFLYVDRVAVLASFRNQQIGSRLYRAVIDEAAKLAVPVVAEVNLRPPNPDSVRFHERHGFSEVGQFEHKEKAVIMMLRQ